MSKEYQVDQVSIQKKSTNQGSIMGKHLENKSN